MNIKLEIGQKLRLFDLHFEVEEKIGYGGFSDVWRLRSIKDGNKIVIKCQVTNSRYNSNIVTASTQELNSRFIQEAESYIEMDAHPNIAYFYGVEKISNQTIIALEYVSGSSLDKWITRAKVKSWKLLLKIAIQISRALVHAHKYGIIHRDIKPMNVLVESDNDSVEKINVKLTDFGLIKLLQSKAVKTDLFTSEQYVNLENGNLKNGLTASGLILGTKGYMSPEQEHTINANIEEESDIFSFGVLLCELITGKLPFERGFIDQDEKLEKYIEDFFKDHKDCPVSLISLIKECLRYQPTNRWKKYKQNGDFKYFQTIENELKSIYIEKVGYEYKEEGAIIQKFDLFKDNSYLPYGFKGLSLLILGRNKKAIKYFDAALKINPNAVEVYNNKGVALKRLHRDNDALNCYEIGIGLDANFKVLYNNKGISLRTCDKHIDAIQCYDRSIKIDPSDWNAHYLKGICYMDLKKYDQALECFEKSINCNPRYSLAYYQKGIVLAQLGNNNDSIPCFDMVIRLEPEIARAYDSKGNVLNDLGKQEEAIACFDKALELEPNNAAVHMNKGVALGRLQKYSDALICFDRASELEPNLDAPYLNKSNALAGLGRYGEAWDNYNKYLAMSKENSNRSNKQYIRQFLSK
jgi:tetratricopeptide (TPR) repeat protein/tRNA A-37 threonylcarbamoyl transferase component Bud32